MKSKMVKVMKAWGFSGLAILLGGVVIFVMLTSFNVSTERNMEAFIHENMEEMNEAAIVSFQNNLRGFTNLLEKEAEIFSMMQPLDDESIMSQLTAFAEKEGFKNAAIVTSDGEIYSSFRGITAVAQDEVLPNFSIPETVISQPRIFYDGNLVIDISTPITLNGTTSGKIVVSLDSDYIAGMFSDRMLQGNAALNLMTQDGTVITRVSRRTSKLEPNRNMFDFYQDPEIGFLVSSPEELSAQMSQGQSIWVKYGYQKSSVCAFYMPFGENGWYMAIAATDSALHTQSQVIKKDAWILTFWIMMVVVAASVVVILQRIREQKRMDALKNTYSIAIKKTNDIFYETDIDSQVFVDHSEDKDKSLWKETPKDYQTALDQVADICAPEYRQQFLDTFLPKNIKIQIERGISSIHLEYKIVPDEHTVRWLSATLIPISDGVDGTKLICMENDITESILNQENLKRSATLDELTGLYNKATTGHYIDRFLHQEGSDGEHALVIIDIDHFKSVNDTLGHAIGDDVISDMGRRLRKIFRKSDIVGRVGGDEFIVLMKDYGNIQVVIDKMKETGRAFTREYTREGDQPGTVKTTASIGIALYNKDGKNFSELYRAADIALYRSKEGGRDTYTFI